MAEKQGFVALYRKIQENFLWQDKRVFSRAEAWIDMLLNVRWAEDDEKVLIGNRIIMCGYGQSLKSLDTWAKRWRWSRSAVSRFFTLLQNENMIVTKSETQTTRLTICNFRQYQELRNADETQMKRIWNASEHRTTKGTKGTILTLSKDSVVTNEVCRDSASSCPHSEIVNLYHEILTELPKVRDWTSKRQEYLRARWKQKQEYQSLDFWKDFFRQVKASSFLTGKTDKPFMADLEWLVKPTNFQKVLEGRYDNRSNNKPGGKWAKYMEENRCTKENLQDS